MSRGSLVLLVLELVGYLGEVDSHLLSPNFFLSPGARTEGQRSSHRPLPILPLPPSSPLGLGFCDENLRPCTMDSLGMEALLSYALLGFLI